MNRFEGKVVLVTGASKGIGKATAKRVGSEGGTAICVARTAADLEVTAAEVRASGGQAIPIAADVMVEAEVQRLFAEIRRHSERIDGLVNNVGGSTALKNNTAPLDEIDLEGWERMMRFNLTSAYLCCRAVAPIMKAQRYGRIVNVSSNAGRGKGTFTSTAYSAAKAGLIGFTRRLAMELAPYNVTVNATAPGLTATERMRAAFDVKPEVRDRQVALTPLGREGTPEDQAAAIAFLASDDAAFITGVTIDVSGGFHME